MDALAARLRELAPLEGFEQASYAGGIEGEREAEFREHGIPVGPERRRDLEDIAAEFGVDVPWAKRRVSRVLAGRTPPSNSESSTRAINKQESNG